MVIRLKDTAKLFGITIIACCAVFVCTLFLSYNIDLAAIKDVITTEAGMAMYNAQVVNGLFSCQNTSERADLFVARN